MTRFPITAAILAALLCTAPVAGPARAADPGVPADTAAPTVGVGRAPKPGQGAQRDFTLRNMSGQTITDAHATVGGADLPITPGGGKITNLQSLSFKTGIDACVDAIRVTLKNGHQLRADGLHDCRAPAITVHADRIEAASSAVGGTVVKPGEGPAGTVERR